MQAKPPKKTVHVILKKIKKNNKSLNFFLKNTPSISSAHLFGIIFASIKKHLRNKKATKTERVENKKKNKKKQKQK